MQLRVVVNLRLHEHLLSGLIRVLNLHNMLWLTCITLENGEGSSRSVEMRTTCLALILTLHAATKRPLQRMT